MKPTKGWGLVDHRTEMLLEVSMFRDTILQQRGINERVARVEIREVPPKLRKAKR